MEINKTFFAKVINLKGNALSDKFGTSIIAQDANLVSIDLQDEAEKIIKDLEDLM